MMALSEELRAIRIERGIGLDDIYHQTKIRVEILERLEAGDFNVAPVPYVRAFLREYAMVLGIDPDIVIAVYEKKRPAIREPRPSTFSEPVPEPPAQEKPAPQRAHAPAPEETFESAHAVKAISDFDGETESISEPADDIAMTQTKVITPEPMKAHEDAAPVEAEPRPEEAWSEGGETGVAPDDTPLDTVIDKVTASDEEPSAGIVTAPEAASLPDNAETAGEAALSGETLNPLDSETVQTTLFSDTGAPKPKKQRRKSKHQETDTIQPSEAPAIKTASVSEAEKPVIRKPLIDDSVDHSIAPFEHREPRKRLEIDDPDTGNKAFFIMFLVLLVIAAAVIVWMNRSGMF